jgi:hypothetical protein
MCRNLLSVGCYRKIFPIGADAYGVSLIQHEGRPAPFTASMHAIGGNFVVPVPVRYRMAHPVQRRMTGGRASAALIATDNGIVGRSHGDRVEMVRVAGDVVGSYVDGR